MFTVFFEQKNMALLSNETLPQHEEFIDSVVSANIPQENTELENLVQKFQVHHHSKTYREIVSFWLW